MNIALVNYAYADDVNHAEALLDRYAALTGWCEALVAAGAARVSVLQRFSADVRLERSAVEYIFRADGVGGDPRSSLWPHRINREAAELRPDVVHVNGLDVPLQTWLLRRVLPASAAIVAQDHAGTVPTFEDRRGLGRGRLAIKRQAMRAIDGFLFASAGIAEPWRRAGLIGARQPVHEVCTGSTTLRPMPKIVAGTWSAVDGDPAVLWVGRLHPIKDPLTVIEAFERSLADLPNAVLTMVYRDGELVDAVRARVQGSRVLQAHVRMAGDVAHAELASFYSAADLFVLGSRHEAYGLALVEACACGATPVVPDIPAFRASTANESIGVLWTPGDVSACTAALISAARRDRTAARANTLEHFERYLSWPAVAERAMAAYADVCARRRDKIT